MLKGFGDFSEAFSPLSAALALLEMARNGDIVHHAIPSLRRVLVSLSLAVVFALPTGVLVGYFRQLEQITYLPFQFMRQNPQGCKIATISRRFEKIRFTRRE
uniref:Uncharacterized protein n=1 Tax=Chlorobium phaeobacteroides (strain BS1) TaxID=331678 RepID=B3EJW0_CHLPB